MRSTPRPSTTRARSGFVVVALVASWMLSGGVMVWGAAAASGSDIAVDIVDDTATPGPSASAPVPQGSSGPGGGSGSGYSGGSGTSSPAPASTPAPATTIPPGERVMFVVSGLTAVGHPTANPLAGGRVTAEVTVQNLTGEALDASADFRVDDIFGNELAYLGDVAIGNLASGDRRTIDVDLGEVRISGLVHVSATVTPPSQVGDLELSPVSRDAWTMLPSWYAVGLFLATAISLATWAYLRYGRKL